MKTSIIKRNLLLFPILAIASVLTGVKTASAWGPERPTFTMEEPASYATFNSITNNPTIGDERDFVRVGQINADVTALSDRVEVLPGHQYVVYIYYHNDASSTYNGPEYGNRGVAFGSRIATYFPTLLHSGEEGTVSATITAENTDPESVWDEAAFVNNTGDKLYLNYVDGSVKIYNDWGVNGYTMPDTLFSSDGAYIGLNALNGVILGCDEYHGVVSYVVEARALSASIEKTASLDGENYAKDLTISPGDEVNFKITFSNSGDVALLNATVLDSLPDGLELVPDSVKYQANNSGVWDQLSDNLVSTGYNFGRFGIGNSATIIYKAKARSDVDCPGIKVSNTASFYFDSDEATGDHVSSSSTVVIERAGCEVAPAPTPDEPKPTPDDFANFTPEEETPTEIVNTGPLEVVMAIVVALAIAGAGFYFWRTKHALRKVENAVKGEPTNDDIKKGQ